MLGWWECSQIMQVLRELVLKRKKDDLCGVRRSHPLRVCVCDVAGRPCWSCATSSGSSFVRRTRHVVALSQITVTSPQGQFSDADMTADVLDRVPTSSRVRTFRHVDLVHVTLWQMFYSGLLSMPADFDAFSLHTQFEAAVTETDVVAEILYARPPAHIQQVHSAKKIFSAWAVRKTIYNDV